MSKVVARFPAELLTCPLIHIHPIEPGEELPASRGEQRTALRKAFPHCGRCVSSQELPICGHEWRCRRNEIPSKSEARCPLERSQHRGHRILDVDPAIEHFVRLNIRGDKLAPDSRIVVLLREKSRGAQNHDWQAALAVRELAE